jgi:hypothetical protein
MTSVKKLTERGLENFDLEDSVKSFEDTTRSKFVMWEIWNDQGLLDRGLIVSQSPLNADEADMGVRSYLDSIEFPVDGKLLVVLITEDEYNNMMRRQKEQERNTLPYG